MIRLIDLLKEGKLTPIEFYTPALPVLDTLLANKNVRRVISSAANSAQYGLSWKEQGPYDDVSFNPKNLKKVDPEVAGRIIAEVIRIVLDEWQDDSNDTTAKQMIDFAPLFVEMSKSIAGINPVGEKAYRGTRINDNKLKDFIKKTKKTDWKDTKIGDQRYVKYVGPEKNSFTYTPKRGVQSWSISSRAASRFGNIVISTDLDETFFFNPSFLHGVTGAFKFEKETVHFGKYPMNVQLFIDKALYNDLSGVSLKRATQDYLKEKISESEQDDEGTLELPF